MRLLTVTLLLAFLGGYADAASFLLNQAFAGHVTGNTVLLGVHVVQGAWLSAGLNVAAVISFLAGTGGAQWMTLRSRAVKPLQRLRPLLLAEGGLLLVALVCHGMHFRHGELASLLPLCFALGWQNGALQKCGTASVHTTFVTGVSTSLLSAVMQQAQGKTEPANPSLPSSITTLGSVLLSFAVGAIIGGWMISSHGSWGLAGVLAPWLVAWLVTGFNEASEQGRPSA